MPDELNPSSRESRSHGVIIALPFILVALIAGYFWADWKRQPSRPQEVKWHGQRVMGTNSTREVDVFYLGFDERWKTEKQIIRGFETLRQELQMCLKQYLESPEGELTQLPGAGNLSLNNVFLDGRGCIVVDLLYKGEVEINFGGVEAEKNFIKSVIRTLKANYPELSSLQLMLNGEIRNTLAGHIDIREPFSF